MDYKNATESVRTNIFFWEYIKKQTIGYRRKFGTIFLQIANIAMKIHTVHLF